MYYIKKNQLQHYIFHIVFLLNNLVLKYILTIKKLFEFRRYNYKLIFVRTTMLLLQVKN